MCIKTLIVIIGRILKKGNDSETKEVILSAIFFIFTPTGLYPHIKNKIRNSNGEITAVKKDITKYVAGVSTRNTPPPAKLVSASGA